MGNVIRYVRTKISHTSPELTDSEAKEYLLSEMATFLVEKLTTPTVAIAQMLVKKVRPGEVLLTFAYSSVISLALRKIWEHVGSDFEIVVVDARPLYEGKKYVRDFKAWREEFPQRPLPRITYCSIASVDFMFTHKHVTKVLLPCSSVLSNGAVLSRAGTSLVASTGFSSCSAPLSFSFILPCLASSLPPCTRHLLRPYLQIRGTSALGFVLFSFCSFHFCSLFFHRLNRA